MISIGLIFKCNPPESLWNPEVHGQCLKYGKLQLAVFSIELALDMVILCLPVRMIVKMKLSRRRKIVISMIFLLGGA